MQRAFRFTTLALLAASVLTVETLAAPRVEMELATESGFSITGRQRWLKFLSELGVDNIRIRSGREGEKPEIIERGTKSNPSFKLIGILTARDRLVLKGGTFARSDAGRLRAYLENLRADGTEGVTQDKVGFGLTARQLIALTKDLETPIDFATRGQPPAKFIPEIAKAVETRMRVDAAVRRELLEAEPSIVEVQGLSAGSGLAALLRPYGMILRPYRKAGEEVQLIITSSKRADEPWPIGWEPEKKDRSVLPALYEFITVEIKDIQAETALAAIQERLKVPFLYDHNNILRHQVDMQTEVSVPEGRSYYKRILERICFQARLAFEVRIDEAGQPFLWITSLKK